MSAAVDEVIALLDGRHRHLFALDGDRLRVAHVFIGQLADAGRERGGEQCRLAAGGSLGEDGFDIFDEAHRKHLIRFVEHDRADRAQVEHFLVEQIEHAPRGADDHVHAFLQAGHLPAVGRTAVDRQHAHVEVLAVFVHGIRHLHGQLAGGSHDQRLCAALTRFEVVENGEGKGSRLAGAGLGLADHVHAGEHERDDGRLDGRGLGIAAFGNRLHQFGAQV